MDASEAKLGPESRLGRLRVENRIACTKNQPRRPHLMPFGETSCVWDILVTKVDPETLLERLSVESCIGCTKNQPRRLRLAPFREVPTQKVETQIIIWVPQLNPH